LAGIDQTKRRRGEEVTIFAFDIQSINLENTQRYISASNS